jgi:hypothetical protein
MKEDPSDQQVRPIQSADNDEATSGWKSCEICDRSNAKSPLFKDFLPRIIHLIEHKTGLPVHGTPIHVRDPLDDFREQIGASTRAHPDPETTRSININAAKPFLPLIAEWLQSALDQTAGLAEITGKGLVTADELCGIVRSLPDKFEEQKSYFLTHEKALRATGQDPKWPKKAESRPKFVADSMAGAEFRLTPATSREFIRRERPLSSPRRDPRKSHEKRFRRSDGRIPTARKYD